MLVFIMVLPRLTDSLHPGNGGNPGFNSYDLDNDLRKVFYPAVIGWSLLAVWITEIRVRIKRLALKNMEL
jgi:heme exporter protein C